MEPHTGNVVEALVADEPTERMSPRGRRWPIVVVLVVVAAVAVAGGLVLGRVTAPGPDVVVAPGPVVEASPEALPLPVGLPAESQTADDDSAPALLVAADSAGSPAVVMTAGDGLSDTPTTAPGYRILNDGISGGQVAAVLASVFGATGSPVAASGSWSVGSADGRRLVVDDDPLVSWRFTDAAAAARPAAGPLLGPDRAVELATALLGSIGVDTESIDWQVDRYSGMTQVTAWQTVARARTSLSWQLGFAPDGTVVSATGFSAGLHQVPGYPVVGARTAVNRTGQAGWNALVPRLVEAGDASVPSPEASVVASLLTVPTTGPSTAPEVSVSPAPSAAPAPSVFGPSAVAGPSPSASPSTSTGVGGSAPDPSPSPRPSLSVPVTTVTAETAELSLAQYWQPDGSVLILPAYLITGSDGSRWSILAVDGGYVDFVATPPVSAAP